MKEKKKIDWGHQRLEDNDFKFLSLFQCYLKYFLYLIHIKVLLSIPALPDINGIESKHTTRYQLCSFYGAPPGQSYQLFGCPSLVYESYACNTQCPKHNMIEEK